MVFPPDDISNVYTKPTKGRYNRIFDANPVKYGFDGANEVSYGLDLGLVGVRVGQRGEVTYELGVDHPYPLLAIPHRDGDGDVSVTHTFSDTPPLRPCAPAHGKWSCVRQGTTVRSPTC